MGISETESNAKSVFAFELFIYVFTGLFTYQSYF